MADIAEKEVKDSMAKSMLKSAGSSILQKVGTQVLNSILASYGINLGGDDSAQFAELDKKLDQISAQITSLEKQVTESTSTLIESSLDSDADDIKSEF